MANLQLAIGAKAQPRSWAQHFISDDQAPDRETLEQLAGLMGVDLEEIEARIEAEEDRKKQLRKASRYQRGTDKRRHKEQRHSSVTQFIEVVEFQGKQLFWSLGGQQFVIGAFGTTLFANDLADALHKLATA